MPSLATVPTSSFSLTSATDADIQTLLDAATALPQLSVAASQGGRALRFSDAHGLQPGDVIAMGDANAPDAPPLLVTIERVGGYSAAITERLPDDFAPASTTILKLPPLGTVLGADTPSEDQTPALPPEEDSPTASAPADLSGESASAPPEIVIDIPLGSKTADIQALVDSAPAGATLRFAAGDYVITEPITINRSDVSLIGAGSDATRLIQSSAMQGEPVIHIGPTWLAQTTETLPELAYTATEGARTLRFSDAHGLEAGDVLYISQANTPAFFEEIRDTKWLKDNPLRTMIVTVERVGGNSIALSEALPFDFDPALTTLSKMDPLTGVTVSGLELTTTYGRSDPGKFSNTISAEARAAMIDIKNTDGLTMRDIHIEEPGSLGVNMAASLNADVAGLSVHGAHNKGSGGNGYGLQIRDVYTSSFTDLEMIDTRHGVLFSSFQTAIGNHVEVTSTNRDVNFHGGLDQDNTVIVESSMRDATEQFYMSPVVSFNEGETWGAPTDPLLNDVQVIRTNGTNKADRIVAHDEGAEIWGFQAADEIFGGRGDDLIFGETGHDVIHASGGQDSIDGGSGIDLLVLEAGVQDYTITRIQDGFTFVRAGDVTEVVDVEHFQFEDMSLSQGQLNDIA